MAGKTADDPLSPDNGTSTDAEQARAIHIPEGPILTLNNDITVRMLRPSDAEATVRHCDNRKIWLRMTNAFSSPYTLENANAFIALATDPKGFVASGPWDVLKGDGTGPAMPTKFAICKNDEVIGGIGLTFQSDILLRMARFGYWLGEDFWYQGIMKQIAPAFLDWGWKTFGRLIRVEGGVYAGNPASCRILERCGLKYMYLAEKGVHKDGKDIDAVLYAMVRPIKAER